MHHMPRTKASERLWAKDPSEGRPASQVQGVYSRLPEVLSATESSRGVRVPSCAPVRGLRRADPVMLDFDHVRGVKDADVKHLVTSSHISLARVFAEIEKCEVRCANCHRRATATRAGYLAYLTQPMARPPSRKRIENACGTRTGYRRGCRCAECREAQRVYFLAWSRAKREGQPSPASVA